MWSWWNSADSVSLVGTIARWTGAFVAISILVLGQRVSTSQKREREPRIITAEQRRKFIEFVSRGDTGKVLVKCILNDKEAVDFASSIKEMLKSAGFEVTDDNSRFIPIDPMSGIQLKVKNRDLPPVHAGTLQKAFESIGIQCPASVESSNDSLGNDSVAIYVASK